MKTLIVISLFIFCGLINTMSAGVKDSVEKYKGTKYIGNIFKNYDYLPEPINKTTKISVLNTIYTLHYNDGAQLCYEPGLQYIYRIPQWNDAKIFWTRSEIGVYVKGLISKNFIFTIGISINARFDKSFYVGYNIGLLYGTVNKLFNYVNPSTTDFYDKYKYIKTYGVEAEVILGYEIYFDNWNLSPELKINLQIMPNIDNEFYYGLVKSPIQLGLNIGKLF